MCDRGEIVVSLLQQEQYRNSERSVEDNKNKKHQQYQAIALHMWKVCDLLVEEHLNKAQYLVDFFSLNVPRWTRSILA